MYLLDRLVRPRAGAWLHRGTTRVIGTLLVVCGVWLLYTSYAPPPFDWEFWWKVSKASASANAWWQEKSWVVAKALPQCRKGSGHQSERRKRKTDSRNANRRACHLSGRRMSGFKLFWSSASRTCRKLISFTNNSYMCSLMLSLHSARNTARHWLSSVHTLPSPPGTYV